MEPQRESDSEGQVEEGVRVALLKLVTDGSRPKGEMSDSWGKKKEILVKHTEENDRLLLGVSTTDTSV